MTTDPLFSVADKITLVSGGSRGIGKAIAAGFAARGAKVIITGRDASTLAATAAEIGSVSNPVVPVVCNVANKADIERAVKEVTNQFGRIDVLLNVAGVNKRKPAETYTEEEFDFIIDINLRGAFWIAIEVGKVMLAQKSGSQIHIDSLNTFSPLKNVTPYAMTKFGISAMSRGLATEWGPRGVRVNALAPGFILTDLTRKLWSDPTMHAWGQANTPLGRSRRHGRHRDLLGLERLGLHDRPSHPRRRRLHSRLGLADSKLSGRLAHFAVESHRSLGQNARNVRGGRARQR